MSANEKPVKLTSSEKKAQKRRETAAKMETIFGTGKGSAEPKLNPLNYKSSLLYALNYYNVAYDNKDKKKWTLSYLGNGKTRGIEELPDWEFHSLGTVIRLKVRGEPLQDDELTYIDTRLKELYDLVNTVKKTSSVKTNAPDSSPKVVSLQDKVKSLVDKHASEFDGMIDEYIVTKKEPDFAGYLKANSVPAQVSKQIPPLYDSVLDEMRQALAGSDADLVEGYSNFTKSELRKLIKVYESISEACNMQAIKVKVERKPRKRKEKPPHVLAAKVKYMKEFKDLDLTSENPTKIVGATEVWIYNTKYKKLQVYRASSGTLTLKGTTIIGYDVEASFGKSLRKPEILKSYLTMNKRTLGTALKSLKTKQQTVNGRINEDSVIFKVFQ